MADRTRRELIAMLRTPTFQADAVKKTFAELALLAWKVDLVAEALAVILDEQRPSDV